ncbi:MAG: TolC family protein [Candidatus Acidiferrales bacterium]|jgi:outer membrane protein TolC
MMAMRKNRTRAALIAGLLLAIAPCAAAQQATEVVAAPPAPQSAPAPVPPPAPAPMQSSAAPQKLTLEDAIAIALRNNLSVLVSGEQIQHDEGARVRAQAALLPQVTAHALVNEQDVNLHALGFNFTIPNLTIPSVIGPFSNFDFRAYASQTIVDRHAAHELRAAEDQKAGAKLDYQDARDQVVRQTAAFYLMAQEAEAQTEAAASRVDTSTANQKLASDQHSAGLATQVDVLRAQVQLAHDQQSVLVARNNYETALMALARYLGLAPGTPLELAEPLEFHPLPPPDVEPAIAQALQARSDYRALASQRQAILEQQKASHARYYPTLGANGNYGAIGSSLAHMPATFLVQATLSVTLFDRDRKGEREELDSQMRQIDDQIGDMARGIEQDLRTALLNLQSAEAQVTVANQSLDLAQKELTLAEDRFRNGLSDNIEVITAQNSVAEAQDDRIAALAQHADASAALARAMGGTEANFQNYVGGSVSAPPSATPAAPAASPSGNP